MEKGTEYIHESYGMIRASRINSGAHVLFGSSIKHSHSIELVISTAKVDRHLDQDWYHPGKALCTIELSPVQFSDLITNMNSQGTPCTIKRVLGKTVENPPDRDVRALHEEEFSASIKEILGDTCKMLKAVERTLNAPGALKVSERKELSSILCKLEQDIRANLPFAHKQFERQMNRTILEAKAEVEAFFLNTIHKLGSDEFKKKLDSGALEVPELTAGIKEF